MGSFNEVCALSSLNIGPGQKVRLLFLTQNPYVKSDEHEARRGCYPTDQWFVRTPPIKGEYADYGECEFKEDAITNLICEVFKDDVIERPFGFNQYHAPDVTKTKGIHHFLHAAREGRLLVADKFREVRPVPAHFPTWQMVQAILKVNDLPIQSESNEDEGKSGYNVQPVMPGVVCVHFNSYEDNKKQLKKIKKILEKAYDCKLVHEFKDDNNDVCLMVAPLGAYDDPVILCETEEIKRVLNTHPRQHQQHQRQLPVLAVMIREDVWQTYCSVTSDKKYPEPYGYRFPSTVADILKKLKQECNKAKQAKRKQQEGMDIFERLAAIELQRLLFGLPFMTTPVKHITEALRMDNMPEELLQGCAELARVEHVMGRLCHSWFIPSLGGQEGNWGLRTALHKEITAICRKEADEELTKK